MHIERINSNRYEIDKNGVKFLVYCINNIWSLFIEEKQKVYNLVTLENCFNAIDNYKVTWCRERGKNITYSSKINLDFGFRF